MLSPQPSTTIFFSSWISPVLMHISLIDLPVNYSYLYTTCEIVNLGSLYMYSSGSTQLGLIVYVHEVAYIFCTTDWTLICSFFHTFSRLFYMNMFMLEYLKLVSQYWSIIELSLILCQQKHSAKLPSFLCKRKLVIFINNILTETVLWFSDTACDSILFSLCRTGRWISDCVITLPGLYTIIYVIVWSLI